MLDGRKRAQRIIEKLLRFDASGVYELFGRIPNSDEENISKAYAMLVYANILSANDLDRASEIAQEVLKLLPDERPKEYDEIVREILAKALRILSVRDYHKGDKKAAKEILDKIIEVLKDTNKPDLKAFLERAKAYRAALFGGEYKASELLKLDLSDRNALSHAIAAAMVIDDIEVLEELMRRALLRGAFITLTNEMRAGLEKLYERVNDLSRRGRAILAFFIDNVKADSDVARFALNREDPELRRTIREKYKGTALEILSLLEEARRDPKYAYLLINRIKELDLDEDFKRLVEAETHLIMGIEFYHNKLYDKALEEALKATNTDEINLLVGAYRLAIEAALKHDTKKALSIMDEAYEKLSKYKGHEAANRLIDVIKKLKPLILLNENRKTEALIEALKSSKRRKK